jgi:hypothetical protein
VYRYPLHSPAINFRLPKFISTQNLYYQELEHHFSAYGYKGGKINYYSTASDMGADIAETVTGLSFGNLNTRIMCL